MKSNPAQVFGALAEFVRALEVLEEYGVPLPGASTFPGADNVRFALVNARGAEDAALGVCFAEIRKLADELFGATPGRGEVEKWKRLESIFKLKNWPDADFLVEQARDSLTPEDELEAEQ